MGSVEGKGTREKAGCWMTDAGCMEGKRMREEGKGARKKRKS